MTTYAAPIADLRFAMRSALAPERGGPDALQATLELADPVLREAARLMEIEVAPGNRAADIEGARFVDGCVHVPREISQAWRHFAGAGWIGMHVPREHGGMGLPKVLAAAVAEMLNASNLSLGSGLLLCDGAIEALQIAGSPAQRAQYLPELIEGRWTGTMNLTEAQAGSDLARIRTIARPEGDHYLLKGQKVFVTFGEQNFSDNIVHLVLARMEGAPPGVKGISLFLCPKYLPERANPKAVRNDIKCLSIEHKLGLRASPTCVLAFGEEGGATGYLIGELNRGLDYMFLMMNAARFTVGVQGIAVAERAFQAASRYARERVQGRPVGFAGDADTTIVGHPDVRRLLLTMKAQIETSRALAFFIADAQDQASAGTGDSAAALTSAIGEFLIPVHKGHATELAVELTSMALQVFGGAGYVEETGVAQLYRDARILPIYEGTTAIQANDLVGRRILRDRGRIAAAFSDRMRSDAAGLAGSSRQQSRRAAEQLRLAVDRFDDVVQWLLKISGSDPAAPFSASVPFLRLCGFVAGGWQAVRALLAAEADMKQSQGELTFLRAKLHTAEFFCTWMLPQCGVLADAIVLGAPAVMDSDASFL